MTDPGILGKLTASLMDDLNEYDDGEIVDVGIVVIVEAEGGSRTHIKCSNDRLYAQLGLFEAAKHCAQFGDEVE